MSIRDMPRSISDTPCCGGAFVDGAWQDEHYPDRLNDLLFDRFEIHKAIVIAPLRVARDTWPAEIEKWDHLGSLDLSVAVGTEAERLAAAETAGRYLQSSTGRTYSGW